VVFAAQGWAREVTVFYWLLKRVLLGPLLLTLFRPWVKGEDHVPEQGGAILASNHLSFSDSIFLPLVLSRRVTFLAKADYFTGRGVKGRLTAGFFKGVGQLPVDRSGGERSEAALTMALEVLREGELLGIYPEGTRSPDGRLYRGKTGVARMALEAKVPVLPVAMVGTDRVQPIGKRIPNIRRVGVVIGKPLDFSRYEGMADDRLVLRSITDEIMYALMELSGQEYTDVYAATMKERLAAAARRQRTNLPALATLQNLPANLQNLPANLQNLPGLRRQGDTVSPEPATGHGVGRPRDDEELGERTTEAPVVEGDGDDIERRPA
jgi:1-acyl-sn-glycerol-3-phosphate acyltransferase